MKIAKKKPTKWTLERWAAFQARIMGVPPKKDPKPKENRNSPDISGKK